MYAPVKSRKGSNASITNSEAETGNLTWLLYYYYQHYDVTRDEILGNKIFSLLKKSINYYIHLLGKTKKENTKLKLKRIHLNILKDMPSIQIMIFLYFVGD